MKYRLFLSVAVLLSALTAQASDDTRISVSEIEATSNISEIVAYGAQIVQPTVTVTKGQPAYFDIDSGNGWWHKKVGDDCVDVRSGTFTSGVWVFMCQVRIDGKNGTTHRLAAPVSTTVDGVSWGVDDYPSVADTYSYSWVESQEFVIEETGINAPDCQPAATDGRIYNLSGQQVSSDYKGIVIRQGRKMSQRTQRGQAPL